MSDDRSKQQVAARLGLERHKAVQMRDEGVRALIPPSGAFEWISYRKADGTLSAMPDDVKLRLKQYHHWHDDVRRQLTSLWDVLSFLYEHREEDDAELWGWLTVATGAVLNDYERWQGNNTIQWMPEHYVWVHRGGEQVHCDLIRLVRRTLEAVTAPPPEEAARGEPAPAPASAPVLELPF